MLEHLKEENLIDENFLKQWKEFLSLLEKYLEIKDISLLEKIQEKICDFIEYFTNIYYLFFLEGKNENKENLFNLLTFFKDFEIEIKTLKKNKEFEKIYDLIKYNLIYLKSL